ncbi:acyltransferase family protein [Solwaraspora sp. WMMB335]|uniref:acyltransferase family protein n=1 Tax=Solwaraspora sp. WMMB335 TaxID=3404118 RepID=UPI003B92CD66
MVVNDLPGTAQLSPGSPPAGGTTAVAPPAAAAVTHPTAAEHGHAGGFRHDIEGLRAVAVLLVVLYHARVPFVEGGYVGVDVFYVISGFVVTTMLVRESATCGRISILGFYARRARRLLPAAILVLLVTLVASWLWLPLQLRWIATQAIASAAYCVNYLLATNSVDYLDAMRRESPLEHYWSLAVEEQFYLVWPLLLVALLAWPRRYGRIRWLVPTAVAAVATLSFVLGVWLTVHSPGHAYFASPARAWEFAVGALIALLAGTMARIPARVAAGMTWAGLGAVLAAALIFDGSTQFPGFAALLPVAGVAMLIAGGCAAHRAGAGGLLTFGLFQRVGRLSYSWYLWHWPFLVIGTALLGGGDALWRNLGLAGAALAAAAVTYSLVENPIRRLSHLRHRPWGTVGLAAVSSAVVVVVAMSATVFKPSVAGSGAPVDTAATLASSQAVERDLRRLIAVSAQGSKVPSNLTPPLPRVAADVPAVFRDGCVVLMITDAGTDQPCVYGATDASQTIVLFGDSHAGSWFPAAEQIALARGWRLVVMVKGFCSAASVRFRLDSVNRAYHECDQWRTEALARIRQLRPLLVITSSTNYTFGDPVGTFADRDQVWTDGWTQTVAKIRSGGSEVVLIGDTPWLPMTVLDCLALHLDDARICHRDVREALLEPRRRWMIEQAAAGQGATVVDPTPWFCTATVCPALVGNVVSLRDGNHMTATYSRLLWRLLDEQIGSRDS